MDSSYALLDKYGIVKSKLKLIKYILFGNFWSFLLVLSGIADIIIGFLVLTDIIHVEDSPFPAYIICFIISAIYLVAGIILAIIKMRKK